MAEIIDLTERFRNTDNAIVLEPLEFRKGDWRSGFTLMCTRGESVRYEAHRSEALRSAGHQHISKVPSHFTLDGGYHYTFLGLFRYRNTEALMRRVYRLAGLMECVTNASSPVLRTDLLRRFYKSILEEREELKIFWRGSIRHFLFPLQPEYHNPNLFNYSIANAASLKDLYMAIESETNTQFDILRRSYVFYVPESLANV